MSKERTRTSTPRRKAPVVRNKYQRGYGTALYDTRRQRVYRGRRRVQRGQGKFTDFIKKVANQIKPALKRTIPGLVRNVPRLIIARDKKAALKHMGKRALHDALQLRNGYKSRRRQ